MALLPGVTQFLDPGNWEDSNMVECVGPGNTPAVSGAGIVSAGGYAWAQNLTGVTFPVTIFNSSSPANNGITGWRGTTATPGNVAAGCAATGITYPAGAVGGGGGVGTGTGRGGHGAGGPGGVGQSSPNAPLGVGGAGNAGGAPGAAIGQVGNTQIIWPRVNAGIGSGGGGGTATVNAGNGGRFGGGPGSFTTGGPNNPCVQGLGVVIVSWPWPLPPLPPKPAGMAMVTA